MGSLCLESSGSPLSFLSGEEGNQTEQVPHYEGNICERRGRQRKPGCRLQLILSSSHRHPLLRIKPVEALQSSQTLSHSHTHTAEQPEKKWHSKESTKNSRILAEIHPPSAAQAQLATTCFTGRPPSWVPQRVPTRAESFSSPFTFPRIIHSSRLKWHSPLESIIQTSTPMVASV